MLSRVSEGLSQSVGIIIDGRSFEARTGDSVAAALLASGMAASRLSPVSGAPRGAYCLMGVCFECLVTIDGVGNRQGCLVEVREGMTVTTNHAATDRIT